MAKPLKYLLDREYREFSRCLSYYCEAVKEFSKTINEGSPEESIARDKARVFLGTAIEMLKKQSVGFIVDIGFVFYVADLVEKRTAKEKEGTYSQLLLNRLNDIPFQPTRKTNITDQSPWDADLDMLANIYTNKLVAKYLSSLLRHAFK